MKPTKGIIPGDRASGEKLRKRIKKVISMNLLLLADADLSGNEEAAWLYSANVSHLRRELAKHDANMRKRFPGWEPNEEEGI